MTIKNLIDTLKPAGYIYIIPDNGDISKAYNSKNKNKKPADIYII